MEEVGEVRLRPVPVYNALRAQEQNHNLLAHYSGFARRLPLAAVCVEYFI
jgi:hypothetical protein